MPPKAASTSSTNSGIKQLSSGESVIPSSTRPDGSVRKEIRVKPGYKPPEDVGVYKNRTAETWKNRGKGGVPGAEIVGMEERDALNPAAANKNAKRKEARKKAAATAASAEGKEAEAGADGQVTSNGNDSKGDDTVQELKVDEVDYEVEKAKEARKLAKKLRQARELKQKKDQGDSLLPEQFAKTIKINELIRQLDILGFNEEGESNQDSVDSSGPIRNPFESPQPSLSTVQDQTGMRPSAWLALMPHEESGEMSAEEKGAEKQKLLNELK